MTLEASRRVAGKAEASCAGDEAACSSISLQRDGRPAWLVGMLAMNLGRLLKSWTLLWNLYSGNQEPPWGMMRLLESRVGI